MNSISGLKILRVTLKKMLVEETQYIQEREELMNLEEEYRKSFSDFCEWEEEDNENYQK